MNNLVGNIDIIIVISFLVINLIVGLYSGRSIKTIKEYAIGNRNFSSIIK
jgi:Na+/proline symporter